MVPIDAKYWSDLVSALDRNNAAFEDLLEAKVLGATPMNTSYLIHDMGRYGNNSVYGSTNYLQC